MSFYINLKGLKCMMDGQPTHVSDGIHKTYTNVFIDDECREFLKAVCEEEGIEWIAKEKRYPCPLHNSGGGKGPPPPCTCKPKAEKCEHDRLTRFGGGRRMCVDCSEVEPFGNKTNGYFTKEEKCGGCSVADGVWSFCDKHQEEAAYAKLDGLLDFSAKISGVPRTVFGKEPERDCYTRAEIDARLDHLTALMQVASPPSSYPTFMECLKMFRDKYLS